MSADPKADLAHAERDAAEARARLNGTVSQLQARLDPKVLAEDAREKGVVAAKAGVATARRNPGILAGVAGLAGLFLLRRPIARYLRHRRASKPVPAQPKSPEPPRLEDQSS